MNARRETPSVIGNSKEQQALVYLEKRGLQLVSRNYRCRSGEIDLIMRDGGCLAFVEVRYRRATGYGTPAETVTRPKQQRIIKAAHNYLQRYPNAMDCRFDVVSITGTDRVEWLKDAFRDN
jgi:putative endonuclease